MLSMHAAHRFRGALEIHAYARDEQRILGLSPVHERHEIQVTHALEFGLRNPNDGIQQAF